VKNHRIARSRRLLLAAIGALSLGALVPAQAQQDYPSRTIKIVVPWPAGGATDNVARVVAQKLSPVLGQAVVVENKPGATGTIGTQTVIQSPPDGYTLLFMAASLHTFSPHLMKGMTFDTVADITPITVSVQFPYVLAVNAESPYRSVSDLVKAAKAQPGKLAYGSFGVGSGPNIVTELFKQQTGTQILHVPYKGGSQVTAALMGGEIPFMFDSLPSPLGQIRGGKLRALAVTGRERSPIVPDVPTLIESGINIEAIIWLGLGGPPKLPPEILNKLFQAMQQISKDPDLQKRIADMGAEATVSKSPQEFREFMLSERERWGKVIRDAKIGAN
jgi:tripartite-type tricarboxylate transporter receptor subunit TctC